VAGTFFASCRRASAACQTGHIRLNHVRDLFRSTGATTSSAAWKPDQLQLAAAALLVEAAILDGYFHERVQAEIRRALTARFELNVEKLDSLMEAAAEAVHEARDLYRFTRAIKDVLGGEERVRIVEILWEVVYADGACTSTSRTCSVGW